MRKDFLELAGVSAVALVMATAPLAAQEAFTDWDANTDAGIDATEFGNRIGEAGLFAAWDADANESLSEEELETALGDRNVDYSAWDSDGDSLIRESEFLSGLYSNYDIDAGGNIDEEEYTAFGNAGLFD